MNPDSPKTPREEMELRITALLLGELSAYESEAVREAIAKDPALAKLHNDLKQTIHLVHETAVSSSEAAVSQTTQFKLSDERRQKLLTHFKTVAPKEFQHDAKISRRALVGLAAAVAVLGTLAVMFSTTSRSFRGSEPGFFGTLGSAPEDAMEAKSAASGDQAVSRTAFLNAMKRAQAEAAQRERTQVSGQITVPSSGITPPPAQIVLPPTALADAEAGNPGAIVVANDSSLGVAKTPTVTGDSIAAHWGTVPAEARTDLYFATQQSQPGLNTDPSTGLPAGTVVANGVTPSATASATEPPVQRFGGGFGGAGGGGGGFGGRGEVAGLRYSFATNSVAQANNGIHNSDEFSGFQLHAGFETASLSGSSGPLLITENAGPPPDANGNKAPILGDLPVAGRLFHSAQSSPATTGHGFSLLGPVELSKSSSDTLTASGANTFVGGTVVNSGTLALGENWASKVDGYNLNVAGIAEDQAVKDQDIAKQSRESQNQAGSTRDQNAAVYHLDHGNPQQVLSVFQNTFPPKPGSAKTATVVAEASPRGQRSPIVLPSNAADADRSAVELTMANPVGEPGLAPARTLRLPGSEGVAAAPAPVQDGKPAIEVAEVSKQDIEKAKSSRPYYEAKQRLEELQNFRSILSMKIASEEADLKLPKETMVAVVDKAEPQSAPSQSLWGRIGGALSGNVERVARVNVQRESTDMAGVSGAQSFQPAGAVDPYFMQTEYEIVRSEAVLGKAVDALKLDEAWGKNKSSGKLKKEEAIALLKQRLEINPVRNTSLLEIRAKSDNPEEAAQIANAVADAYRDYRLERNRGKMEQGIAALKQEMDKQQKELHDAEAEVERLRIESNIEQSDVAIRKPLTNAPIPQPEILTSENNFSTFSLNVSDVSFKLAAASLEKGQMPDAASVRSEEFINAFDYRDPEPLAGAPLAFAYERARYPFAHNRDLLRFSLKTAAAGREAGRPLNIVLLLDNSGSMERADRVQIIREALHVLASQLQPQDKLSVITFARTARLFADGVSGDKAGEIAEQVSGLTPEGGTNLEDAMNLAYQTAARHYLANGINRVVLLTDGAANLGDVEPDSLKQKVEAQRKQGIALDCFGIGWEGFNDDLLEVLSRNGDGRYGFINSPEEAATEFAGQLAGALKVAASDVKVQVEFNPKRVTSYRQIGYAKHQLTKEQFRDNSVDAAEIAAQEAGNGLYTVEVNPSGEGPVCTVRVRYKIPGTTDYREHAWDVPFSGNAVSLEQASPAMRLAASASAFSEWLVASPFAGEVTPDQLLGVLRGVPEIYGADARPKKLEWMIRQAKSLAGQ